LIAFLPAIRQNAKQAMQQEGYAMAKRPSLAERMREVATPDALSSDAPQATPSRQSESSEKPPARTSGFYAATRVGKKKVTASLDPAAHKQLRQLGLDRDMTTEALLIEAINDLFKKYAKRPIA
jgi:antitoxin-like ribbon-helix-helix protein